MSNVKQLRKTIPFKWRVQSVIKGTKPKAKMIAYVDARDVAEHLDNIVGSQNWCDEYYEVNSKTYCRIGIKVGDEWIFKSDVGSESKVEGIKGEASDAFKRAAVKWGINRDAYRVGIVELPAKEYNGKFFPIGIDNKFVKGQEMYDLCNTLADTEGLENYDLEPEDNHSNVNPLFNNKEDGNK